MPLPPLTPPPKLRAGDRIHVIAPSQSYPRIRSTPVEWESYRRSIRRLEDLGLRVTEGLHVDRADEFGTASVAQRLEDLHQAFADPEIRGILTVIGGFNANQLLSGIDFDLIAANPKIFCGYSDITVLQGAMLQRAGLISYSGPHISTLGMRDGLEHTLLHLQRALLGGNSWALESSAQWSEDPWFLDQDARSYHRNPGLVTLQPGEAEGRLIGGNLQTFNLLKGTPFFPSLQDSVLFFEDLRPLSQWDRQLQSLLQTPEAAGIRGLVIGRFPRALEVTAERMSRVIETKAELRGLPVLFGGDFGHTTPHWTLPVGGRVRIQAPADGPGRVEILMG